MIFRLKSPLLLCKRAVPQPPTTWFQLKMYNTNETNEVFDIPATEEDNVCQKN